MLDENGYERPILTTDIVIATLHHDQLHVLLHRRPNEPCEGKFALPGGWIRVQEDGSAEAAAERILRDKIGMSPLHFEQLGTYSGADRDPRGWSATIVFLAILPEASIADMLSEDVILAPAEGTGKTVALAFDHEKILNDAARRIRAKASYSMIPSAFIGDEFTLPELQNAFEILLDRTLTPSSFRRKVLSLDLIEHCGSKHDSTRPAKLYRLKEGIKTFDRSMIQSW